MRTINGIPFIGLTKKRKNIQSITSTTYAINLITKLHSNVSYFECDFQFRDGARRNCFCFETVAFLIRGWMKWGKICLPGYREENIDN